MSVMMTRRSFRRQYRLERLIVIIVTATFGLLLIVGYPDRPSGPGGGGAVPGGGDCFVSSMDQTARKLLQTSSDNDNETTRGLYPPEAFTMAQLKSGAVILYIFGMIYMFLALAIVCDEFFVPALEAIIQSLRISEDVAGATFMAAGGSAPELFTSIFGVFIARSDVGIGTIVGSAVFNILFVIGMCAMFSASVLALTWWPLFRDVTFYSISLITLIVFFVDQEIYYWEALILICIYACYVIFMKFNHNVERWTKSKFKKNRVNSATTCSTDTVSSVESGFRPVGNIFKSSSGKFRHGVLQLMIHTIDPLGDAKVHDKALKLHAIASLKTINNGDTHPSNNHNNPSHQDQNTYSKNGSVTAISNGIYMQNNVATATPPSAQNRNCSQQTTITRMSSSTDNATPEQDTDTSPPTQLPRATSNDSNNVAPGEEQTTNRCNTGDTTSQADEMEDITEPLDISWPRTARKRLTYILMAPIIFPLWITLPDVRRPDRRKYYPWSFVGSILWIGAFSYLMNWWASTTGSVFGIPDAVMGLTFLAAGTSIPDLITSVIVAKKGFGDMAVSSSVGSNIFDVTMGLPLPWLVYGLIYGEPYLVNSKGLFCSIVLLFVMLLFVIASIAAFKWKMNKPLGATMFVMYTIFLAFSLLLEYNILPCPIA